MAVLPKSDGLENRPISTVELIISKTRSGIVTLIVTPFFNLDKGDNND